MAKYTVWSPEHGGTHEDGQEFDARNAEHAAKLWARWEDAYSAEYSIVGGAEIVVRVRGKDGEELEFTVTGEAEPVYYARANQQEGRNG